MIEVLLFAILGLLILGNLLRNLSPPPRFGRGYQPKGTGKPPGVPPKNPGSVSAKKEEA